MALRTRRATSTWCNHLETGSTLS